MITDNTKTAEELNKSNSRFYSGFTLFKNLNRKDCWCPRCAHNIRRPTVDKQNRKCSNCAGKLLWKGDSFNQCIEDHVDFYCWDTYNGLTGWYHSSFYGI